MRQSSNKTSKDNALHQKVLDLEDEHQRLQKSLELTSTRLNEVSSFVIDQKNKYEEINSKLNKLVSKKRFTTQAVQTTSERKQIGKILYSKSSLQSASCDVKNSIIYQCTELALNNIFT
jgi:hypothetical protein